MREYVLLVWLANNKRYEGKISERPTFHRLFIPIEKLEAIFRPLPWPIDPCLSVH